MFERLTSLLSQSLERDCVMRLIGAECWRMQVSDNSGAKVVQCIQKSGTQWTIGDIVTVAVKKARGGKVSLQRRCTSHCTSVQRMKHHLQKGLQPRAAVYIAYIKSVKNSSRCLHGGWKPRWAGVRWFSGKQSPACITSTNGNADHQSFTRAI